MIDYKAVVAITDGTDYPFTEPQNASGPTATDGSAFISEWLKQHWGFFQACLASIGIAPSGTADQADASEVLDAIVEQAMGRAQFVIESGGSAADVYVVEANIAATPQGTSTGANGVAHSYFAGMVLIFDIAAVNTGSSTVNAFGLGAEFIKTPDGNNVVAGDLDGRLVLRYDGTNFVVIESNGAYFVAELRADTLTIPGGAPLPRGYLGGLTISNNVLDSAKDIDVSVGECKDSTNLHNIVVTAAIGKQTNATWAAGGTPAATVGGMNATDDPLAAAATTIHVFVLGDSSDVTNVDVGFDTNANAVNLLADAAVIAAGLDLFRKIGSVGTDATPDVKPFIQTGDKFQLDVPVQDITEVPGSTDRQTVQLPSVPDGIVVDAWIHFFLNDTDVNRGLITPLDIADSVPSTNLKHVETSASSASEIVEMKVRTDTSSQISYRLTDGAGQVKILVNGWIDRRGQDA